MEIKMTIIYEKADGLIQASVAELPGAISLGADVEEARRNLDEANRDGAGWKPLARRRCCKRKNQ